MADGRGVRAKSDVVFRGQRGGFDRAAIGQIVIGVVDDDGLVFTKWLELQSRPDLRIGDEAEIDFVGGDGDAHFRRIRILHDDFHFEETFAEGFEDRR